MIDKQIRYLFALIFFSLSFNHALAFENDVTLNDFGGHISLSKHLLILQDEEGKLAIDDIIAPNAHLQWQPSTQPIPNLGLGVSPHWFSVTLHNNSNSTFNAILDMPYTMMDYLDIYLINDDNIKEAARTGDQRLFSTRPLAHRNFLVPIEIPAGQVTKIIIRGESYGAMKLPLELWSTEAFFKSDQLAFAAQLLFVGAMLALIIYNFFLLVVTRDQNYLWYVLSITSITFVVMSFHGVLAQFAWPDTPSLNNTVLVGSISTNIFAATLFAYHFLELKRLGKVISYLMLGHTAMGAVIFILNWFLPYTITIKLVALFSCTGATFGILIGIYLWWKGEILARFYTISWALLLSGSVAITLSHMGILPSIMIFDYGQQIGAVSEGLLLSFALAYRIKMERQKRFQAQASILEIQRTNNIKLEQKNNHINQILMATIEMASSSSEFHAGRIALFYLNKLDPRIRLDLVYLYLPYRNSKGYARHKLYEQGISNEEDASSATDKEKIELLEQVQKATFHGDNLILPLNPKNEAHAFLEITNYQTNSRENFVEDNLLSGITNALALKLENLRADENSRLQSIGAMASAIIHDLKNPIGAILGYADLSRDSTLPPSIRNEYLDIISQEASRLSAMAHEVLEFSRDDIQLNINSIESTQYIHDLGKVLSAIFESRGIELRIHIHYHGMMKLDAERIRRVILNLATNARDAMSAHYIARPRFDLTLKLVGSSIVIEAKDNGPGIPEHIQADLFEPFVTHGKANGTGLGLAIVKKLVNAHRGDINFESNPTDGTTFSIELPQTTETLSSKPPSGQEINDPDVSAPTPTGLKKSILVADDNDVNLKMLMIYLKKLGYRYQGVRSGREAIEAVKKHSFDAILMDIEMPEMNGLEATRVIRNSASAAFANLPIFALTGHAADNIYDDAKAAGMTAILSKPVKINDLMLLLRDHFDDEVDTQSCEPVHKRLHPH